MEVRRGEIYWADLNIYNEKCASSSLQKGLRPILVCSNELNNKYSPTINAYAITSRMSKSNIPVHVLVGEESGLPKDSVVLVEQQLTVDKRVMLKSKIGEVPEYVMENIEFAHFSL
jgi:mRNA interferase MazF